MQDKKLSICFCSLNSDYLISGKEMDNIGGAELQQMLLSKKLHEKGFNISYIVFDHGQESREIIDGITILNVGFPRGYLLSGIRSYLLVLYLYWKALNRANADIYYIRCAGRDLGLIALFCLLKGKKFVFSIAHDTDVDGTYAICSTLCEKISIKIGIKRANCIVAQSEYQQKILKVNYKRESYIIRNGLPLDDFNAIMDKLPIVLWVGTVNREWKQPILFLKLAEELPELRFQMVGGASSDNEEYFRYIKHSALKLKNLDFCGFIPYKSINNFFCSASLLVNTSKFEGFPNTFIQAWGNNIPVVSLNVDPDEIICKNQLGFHSKTFDQMKKDVKILMRDSQLRKEMGKNGRDYVEKEHDLNKMTQKYIEIIKKICQ